MERKVVISGFPENLNSEWDNIADCYFQKRDFLTHLHKYNPCSQHYYELYHGDKLVAGTVVYTLKINLLTFLNIPSPLTMNVIGLPVSVAASPLIGDTCEFQYLLDYLLKKEKGFILALNVKEDFLVDKVLNIRTLPTFILKLGFNNIESYENSLRHDYRRRLHKFKKNFINVRMKASDCSLFNEEHYRLYLEIMKRTKTKLETLRLDLFQNLPSNFVLTTYYNETRMLCWHITCNDGKTLFFFFGGMEYSLRDHYQSYHNNLYGIITEAIQEKCDSIDLGQTAETAKTRLGGKQEERKMFLYHRNPLILNFLRPFKRFLTYSKTIEKSNVFKTIS
jgi:hypothetical protein